MRSNQPDDDVGNHTAPAQILPALTLQASRR